jgi:hypothetical protein
MLCAKKENPEGNQMKKLKFDETDREKVISEIEKFFKVILTRSGRRRKSLSDQNKKSCWVLGGYDNWHGIPPDMMAEEKKRSTNGILVVAKRYTSRIDIFIGSLQKLVDNENFLSHTQNGDFQFNIDIRGDHLFVKEVDGLTLIRLGGSTYSQEDKEIDSKDIELKGIIRGLSLEQKRKLIEELVAKSNT